MDNDITMYRNVLFTHNDLDGIGCRVLFELSDFYDPATTIIKHSTYKSLKWDIVDVLNDGHVAPHLTTFWFTDICPDQEMIKYLVNGSKFPVRLFDHHVTAKEVAEMIPGAVVQDGLVDGHLQSGTSLLHRYLIDANAYKSYSAMNGTLEQFVEQIRCYDTYEWKAENIVEPKMLNMLLYSTSQEAFIEEMKRRIREDSGTLTGLEWFLQGKMAKEASICAEFERFDLIQVGPYTGAYIDNPMNCNISELAHSIQLRHPEIDLIVGFSFSQGGKLEIRTIKDNVDVSEVAKKLGGGGHVKASGVVLPGSVRESIRDCVERMFLTAYGYGQE